MRRSRQACAQAIELNLDDLAELVFGERVEDDDLVDAVEELGPEMLAQFVQHGRPHDRVFGAARRPRKSRMRLDCRCSRS